MANSFRLLKRNCPICDGARRDCRENSTSSIVHCRYENVSSIAGFRFLGQDKLGFSMWAPDQGQDYWSGEDWEAHRQQLELQRQTRLKSESEQRAQLLPINERDQEIRKLAAQLTLNHRHRVNLRDRGLTDIQIDLGLFCSVDPGHHISDVSPRLAGVDLYGRKLLVKESGFICPIWNPEGQVVGWQTRFDNAEDSRYRWPTSQHSKFRPNGPTAHLPNGELPISVCRPVGGVQSSAIGLSEGFLKPYIAAQKLGHVVIGAAGGNFASSPEQLRQYLNILSRELGTKRTILYPDAGAITNKSVMRQYKQTLKLLKGWGYQIEVAWWQQNTKDDPDIDELDDTKKITYLTLDQLLEQSRWELIHQKARESQTRLNRLTYQPTTVLNQPYLSDIHLPQPGSYLFLSSPMGSGKTTTAAKLLQEFKTKHPGKLIRLFGYRNGLLRQTGDKLNIDLLHDLEVDAGQRRVTEALINNTEAVSACLDSLLRFDISSLDGALILFDEIDAVIKHLVLGHTCQEKRAKIMVHLSKLLQHVIGTGGYIVGMEANLTDLPIDTLRGLVGLDVHLELIVNQWQRHPWQVSVCSESPSGLINEVVAGYQHQGLRQVLATDSQKFAEQMHLLFNQLNPQAKVLRVDGQTSEKVEIREFLTRPNQVIEREKPDLLIYSPTMESGADITTHYFDRMLFHFVNLETRAQLQMLGRIRQPIPRLGYVLEYANFDEEGRSLRPEILEKDLRKNAAAAEQLTTLAVALAQEEDPDASDWLQKLNDLLNPDIASPEKFWVEAYCKYQARANGARATMRASLIQALKQVGHQVEEVQLQHVTEVSQIRQMIKAQLEEAEATKLYQADDQGMTVERAHGIFNSAGSTEEKRLQAKKALLRDKLPGVELTKEFLLKAVVQERGALLKSTTLFWFSHHPQIAQELDRRQMVHTLKQPFCYLPDLRLNCLKVDLLNRLKINQFIQAQEYRNEDPALSKLKEQALWLRWEIKRVIGLTITEQQSPIRILSKLLSKLGYGLESRKCGPRGQQVRIWYIANLEDGDRTVILEAIDRKYAVVDSSDKYQSDTVSTTSSINPSLEAVDTFTSNNTCTTKLPSLGQAPVSPPVAICEGDTVRRHSDRTLFRVKQIKPGAIVRLKWLNQVVPLLDICCPLAEVELVKRPGESAAI